MPWIALFIKTGAVEIISQFYGIGRPGSMPKKQQNAQTGAVGIQTSIYGMRSAAGRHLTRSHAQFLCHKSRNVELLRQNGNKAEKWHSRPSPAPPYQRQPPRRHEKDRTRGPVSFTHISTYDILPLRPPSSSQRLRSCQTFSMLSACRRGISSAPSGSSPMKDCQSRRLRWRV